MSQYYGEKGKYFRPKWGPGRTKQAFKDTCDINKIIKRAQKEGALSHLQKYPEAIYGEFSQEFDLLTAHSHVAKANEIFGDLPSEVRREFGNDALKFVSWAGSLEPGELAQQLPELAKPGSYFPNPVSRGGQGAGLATAPAPSGAQGSEATENPSPPASEAQAASQAAS